jgi:hypothetical protein
MVHKRPVHHRQLLIHDSPSRYTAKYSTLATTNICNTIVVVRVETESRASVNTGGIIRTSEMSVLLKALIDLSATPVYFRPSLEPTNGLSPCSFTDKAD